jgi:trehalose 6-phosphate synthase
VTVAPAEAARRIRVMQRYLRSHDVDRWARTFLTELGG